MSIFMSTPITIYCLYLQLTTLVGYTYNHTFCDEYGINDNYEKYSQLWYILYGSYWL